MSEHLAENDYIDREALGRIVRQVWVEWAQEQPNPKPSWLVPWDDLPEPDREVDRRIGERLARCGARVTFDALERELGTYARRGSPSAPQWAWAAFDKVLRLVFPPAGSEARDVE